MPAATSSLIAVLAPYAGAEVREPDADLFTALARVPDPRASRGVRHQLVTVLAIGVAAVLAGARSWVAIGEWAQDLPVSARMRLGIGRAAPSESTIRRVLRDVDPDALDTVLCGWLAARLPPAPSRSTALATTPALRPVAVDGKTARGARTDDGQTHLLAAFDQASGVVLGQDDVAAKTNEITGFTPLLDRVGSHLDLARVLVTADALHTQRAHAEELHARGGHYLLIAKANQPRLHDQLRGLGWAQIPVVHTERDRGHGREEIRRLKLAAVRVGRRSGIEFPHAELAIQVQRRRRAIGATRWEFETVYAVTDLTWRAARPEVIAAAIRGHWRIENQLHWVRDVTFGEDLSQIRTANAPRVMAGLRNFAVSRHRLAGATNIARACRDTARHPNRALALLT